MALTCSPLGRDRDEGSESGAKQMFDAAQGGRFGEKGEGTGKNKRCLFSLNGEVGVNLGEEGGGEVTSWGRAVVEWWM